VLALVAEIAELVGRLSLIQERDAGLRLRRINRIRTIQGTLAIEGSGLTTAQVTAILEGRRVLAPPREIQEARNALAAYDRLSTWKPQRAPDLLQAHGVLMEALMDLPVETLVHAHQDAYSRAIAESTEAASATPSCCSC
jgi:Fic family protein